MVICGYSQLMTAGHQALHYELPVSYDKLVDPWHLLQGTDGEMM